MFELHISLFGFRALQISMIHLNCKAQATY